MHNESMNVKYGGSSDPVPDSMYPVKIYNDYMNTNAKKNQKKLILIIKLTF